MFEQIAAPNYRKGSRGVETCGILCGKEVGGQLLVTHLVVPRQVGDEDNCEMLDENRLLSFCVENDLITLSWIHTHPSQGLFLSSQDLHTHHNYQNMVPEAVAIVLAPNTQKRFAIFRLTNDPRMPTNGLDVIQSCPLRGFHPHDVPFPVFEEISSSSILDPELPLKLVDLRN
jgi:STAM-binding protein